MTTEKKVNSSRCFIYSCSRFQKSDSSNDFLNDAQVGPDPKVGTVNKIPSNHLISSHF
jgi:hypothetical protein